MFNFAKVNLGYIRTLDNTKKADIIAKSFLPTKVKDLLIGGGLVLLGGGYLLAKAFSNGANEAMHAQYDAEEECGLHTK